MKDVTLFAGGSIGSDPYARRTWSGITHYLLKAMQDTHLLDKAVGVNLPRLQTAWFQGKNFSTDRRVWRKKFFMDVGYRNAMTRAAEKLPVSSPVLMQIGHWYCLPDVFPDKVCISYHDGNLAQSLHSGFGFEGIPRQVIDATLRYEQETAQKMTAIFTFSEYLRQSFIRDYGVKAERVFTVGGAPNFDEIPPVLAGKQYDRKRILFVGIEFKRKGGLQLLEAFRAVRSAVPDAELHIVGPDSIEEAGDGVIFHGRLSKHDPAQSEKLNTLFQDASLFVLPSLYEPFGIAPLEAMLYQVPCILTNDWAFPEFVTPDKTGALAAKGNVEELAAAMIAMLSDPSALQSMGHAARESVLRKYTWHAVAGRMSAAISKLS